MLQAVIKICPRTRKWRNSGRPWSKFDRTKLIKLYPKTHNFELARMFGRTEEAVLSQGHRFGLHKEYDDKFKLPRAVKGKNWNNTEIGILKKMYLTHPFAEISGIIDRSPGAIAKKAVQLKLKKIKFWIKKEDAYIRRFFASKTAAQIGKKLGRTFVAVTARAKKLGLERKVDYWTDEETKILKRYYKKMAHKDLAKKVGRDRHSVASRISKMGFIKLNKWKDVSDKILIKEYKKGTSLKKIGQMVGRTAMACRRRASKLKLYRTWAKKLVFFKGRWHDPKKLKLYKARKKNMDI